MEIVTLVSLLYTRVSDDT